MTRDNVIKIKRSEASLLYRAMGEALAQSDPKIKFDLQVKLIGTKHQLKSHIEQYDELMKDATERSRAMQIDFCTKREGENGTMVPLIISMSNGEQRYAGLIQGQCLEYDAESKALETELKNFDREEIEVEVVALKESDLPRTVRGTVTEQLMRLVQTEPAE